MALAPRSRLGPYEIVAPIGAGGMGEVYRARDERLDRSVAIKVMPPEVASDPDRLRRFEQEARAVGQLNHPNVLSVFDVGMHDGGPYLVTELLEGETLREKLAAGALPPRRAVEIAVQIARGLAAAHERGIVHRDLKPENVFVMRDGRVKILDFGLAKLNPLADGRGSNEMPTLAARTDPGVILGTVGYMSPEQVRGQPADQRADLFALGAILYEMLAGGRAFRGASGVEVLNAILKEDPPPLSSASATPLPPALEPLVRHCLEKEPDHRFQSARDLAFQLETLGTTATAILPRLPAPARPLWRRVLLPGVAIAALLLAALAFVRQSAKQEHPSFRRLTFRRGVLDAARFTSDGASVVYSAAWDGEPLMLYSARIDAPDPVRLGVDAAGLADVAPAGDVLCVPERRANVRAVVVPGTLARAPLAGGPLRPLLDGVVAAEADERSGEIIVVRRAAARSRIESPPGTLLYETSATIDVARRSPDGKSVAFTEHVDGSAKVCLLEGKEVRVLSEGWIVVIGLAWSPRGEVWFTATRHQVPPSLWAVSRRGKLREVYRSVGWLTLHDIAADGRLLLSNNTWRGGLSCMPAGETKERDLSWLEWSSLDAISRDGKWVLFEEDREGGGVRGTAYLRSVDGSPPVRIGDGYGGDISPDNRSVLTSGRGIPLTLIPVGTGEARELFQGNARAPRFLPDGKRIAFLGTPKEGEYRVMTIDVAGGAPRVLTPLPATRFVLTADGRRIAVREEKGWRLYSFDGKQQPEEIVWAQRWEGIAFASDGVAYVYDAREVPVRIRRVDPASGAQTPWKEIAAADPAGLTQIGPIEFTPDMSAYAYSWERILSDLYVVEGLR